MLKYCLPFLLAIGATAIAAEEDLGVIITNYRYDEFGRPRGSYSYPVNRGYGHPYYNAGYNPYYDPYYPESLPGADPDRFEDIFEENRRK